MRIFDVSIGLLIADRLALIDGSSDVWLDLCYHSELAPSPRISSDLHPEYLINGGGHHWDSYGILDVAAEPQFIREAHYWEIRTVKRTLRNLGLLLMKTLKLIKMLQIK